MNPLLQYLSRMMQDEGAITIVPRPEQFREQYQYEFVDRIRRLPASQITGPPNTSLDSILFGRGTWAFVWVPDRSQ